MKRAPPPTRRAEKNESVRFCSRLARPRILLRTCIDAFSRVHLAGAGVRMYVTCARPHARLLLLLLAAPATPSISPFGPALFSNTSSGRYAREEGAAG